MSSNKTLENVELHQENDEYYLTLTYNEKLGDNFEVVKDIDVDNIRRMILKGEIPNSEIKKTFFKILFCFQKQNKILKKKVKDIKSTHIRYTYKRDKGIFSFAELKKRLSTKEYEEFWREIS